MARENEMMKTTKAGNITIQSLLDSTLIHGDIVIAPKEIVIVDKEIAEELVAKGFVKVIEVKRI